MQRKMTAKVPSTGYEGVDEKALLMWLAQYRTNAEKYLEHVADIEEEFRRREEAKTRITEDDLKAGNTIYFGKHARYLVDPLANAHVSEHEVRFFLVDDFGYAQGRIDKTGPDSTLAYVNHYYSKVPV